MRQEVFTLTQQERKPYAEERVIFMAQSEAQDTEQLLEEKTQEQEKREKARTSSREATPEDIHQEVKKVLDRLEERVKEVVPEAEKIEHLTAEEFRDALDDINLEEIEKFLREIRDVTAKVAPEQRREILQAEEKARALEETVTKRRIEGLDITKTEGGVGAQVFAGFQKFLGIEGVTVQVDPSAQEVSIHKTVDGQQVVAVPKPTLENMIAVARQLNIGEFSEETKNNLVAFADELKNAAILLDHRVFSPEAIMVLYNAGYQLEQVAKNPQEVAQQGLKKIDSYHTLFGEFHDPRLQPQNITPDTQNKIFLDIFMGQHDLADTTKRTFYSTYFKRWQIQQQRENPDLLNGDLHDQQETYNKWLLTHQGKMFGFMRRFIERTLSSDGKAAKFVVEHAQQEVRPELMHNMLDPWRILVEQAEMSRHYHQQEQATGEKTKEAAQVNLGERLKQTFPEGSVNRVGLYYALEDINNEFRPDRQAEVLDYVPAHLVEKLAAGERDAAACVIVAAYEKGVLENVLGDGYIVIPEVAGNHARLLVADIESKQVYRIDPNIPTDYQPKPGEKPVKPVELLPEDDAVAQRIAEAIRLQEDTLGDWDQEVSSKAIEVAYAEGDHIVMSGDRLLTSALLSNMAALGDNAYFQAKSSEELRQLQLSAVEDALRLVPQNHMAARIKEKLQTSTSAAELVRTQNLPQETVEEVQSVALKEHLIGSWTPPRYPSPVAGNPPLTTPPPEVNRAIAVIQAELNKPTAQGLEELPAETLNDLINMVDKAIDNIPDARQDDFFYARNLRTDLREAYSKASDEAQRKQQILRGSGEEDVISSFNLTPRETRIFIAEATPANIKEMERKLGQIVRVFGRDQDPGFIVTSNAANIAHGKVDDIIKLLTARRDLERNLEIQKLREEAIENGHILISPFIIAASQESGDPEKYAQAGEQANQMDSAGGHDTHRALLRYGEGRSSYFYNEMFRVMDWWRGENLHYTYDKNGKVTDVSIGSISPAQYKEIRGYLVEKQYQAALSGSGLYAEELLKSEDEATIEAQQEYMNNYVRNNPDASDSDIRNAVIAHMEEDTVKDQVKERGRSILREKINVEAIFGHVAFINAGRAKELGIVGEDFLYDPTTSTWPETEKNSLERWDELSPARREYFNRLLDERMKTWVRLNYGEEVLEHIEKQAGKDGKNAVLRRITRHMGFDLTSHYAKGRWQNEYLFTRVDTYAANEWRENKYGKITADGLAKLGNGKDSKEAHKERMKEYSKMFAHFLRLHDASEVIRPHAHPESTSDRDTDPLIRYIVTAEENGKPKYYDAEYASKLPPDRQAAYKKQCIQYGMMNEVIAPFFPDEIIRQFAFEPDMWADKNAGQFDSRFVKFFNSDAAKFLDNLAIPHTTEDNLHPGRPYDEALAKVDEIFGKRFPKSNPPDPTPEKLAQIRFRIFQEHVLPLMTSIRERHIENAEPRQVNFGVEEFTDFNVYGNGTMQRVSNLMRAMTKAVTEWPPSHHFPGVPHDGIHDDGRNSLIGRLAFDPTMMQALYRSPLSLVDTPYWMLHGSDPYERDAAKRKHPADIKNLYGGSNQFGRAMGYVKDSVQSRMALVEIAKADFNHFEETIFKPLDAIVKANAAIIGREFAAQIKFSLVGKLFEMMTPEFAELFGLENLPVKDSEMRHLFNRWTRATNDETKKNWFQQNAHTFQRKEYLPLVQEILFGKKLKRTYRSLWKIFYALLLMTIAQTMTTGGAVFQGELKAAG